jgi:hypothetical protein
MPPSNVSGTVPASGADMPVLPNKPRKRKRLVNLSANRGPNQGAPPSDTINVYPFPFAGLFQPARHGHHPVFGVGTARRVAAWRTAATGTMGGNHKRSGNFR